MGFSRSELCPCSAPAGCEPAEGVRRCECRANARLVTSPQHPGLGSALKLVHRFWSGAGSHLPAAHPADAIVNPSLVCQFSA